MWTPMEPQAPTCIVCLRNDGGANSREHVLQNGLGARFTLPRGVLCDRCNNATSTLDKALLDFVTISMRRNTERSILSGGTAICKLEGRWWRTYASERSWNRPLPPQLLILADGTVKAWGANRDVLHIMRSELQPIASPEIERSELRVLGTELSGQPLIVRSKPNAYHILAANKAEQRAAEQIITSGQLSAAAWDFRSDLAAILKGNQTPVVGALPFPMDHAHRSLYKVFLNLIAYTLTPELARLRVFDTFRQAILEGKIDNKHAFEMGTERIQRIAQDGERIGFGQEAAIFLALFGQNKPAQAQAAAAHMIQPGKHSLVIGCAYGHINALVTLYGVPHANLRYPVPRLDWCPSGIWSCAIIDPENGASRNDGVARPAPEALEHITRYLHELSSKYEGARVDAGFELLPSKPRLVKLSFTYEACSPNSK
jgi:hypothetical protein